MNSYQAAVPLDDWLVVRKVERDDRNAALGDQGPDVQLGSIRERKYAQAFTRVQACVVKAPELRSLCLGVPSVRYTAEGDHTLLGAGCLFVTPGTTERGAEAVQTQGLQQSLGLHDAGVVGAAVGEWRYASRGTLRVGVDDHAVATVPNHPVPEGDHLAKLPASVHVKQRKR